jgi:hypothetical protein
MEKRVETADGRVFHVHVNAEAVVDETDERPPIESDPDDLDEGATEALVLVEPKPSTMTVEGAVVAVGVTARHLWGSSGPAPMPGSWWNDWGKYVVLLAVVMIAVFGVQFFG